MLLLGFNHGYMHGNAGMQGVSSKVVWPLFFWVALVCFFWRKHFEIPLPAPLLLNISHSQFLSSLSLSKKQHCRRWWWTCCCLVSTMDLCAGCGNAVCKLYFLICFFFWYSISIICYFTSWRVAIPLLLSHPETCVDMAGWPFLLFGSTVAICVVSGAAEDGYDW